MIQDPVFWIALAVSCALFWLVQPALRRPLLAALSAAMLAYYDLASCGLLICLSVVLYFLLPAIASGRRHAFPVFLAAIMALLTPLITFKTLAVVLADPGQPVTNAGDILVPLGLSYYVFRLLHIAIDTYRRQAFEFSAKDYFCWVFLFTIIVAGPIQRLDGFVRGAVTEFQFDHLLHGATRIAYGVVKQTFVIDLALALRDLLLFEPVPVVTPAVLQDLPTADVWTVVVFTYLTSYLNLGAYTDIAIGSSRLFGFTISENFRFPVLARNVGDFWRRWHLTLSNWCSDYVFSPVLGWSRNPYLALFLSFQVMGLWHMFTLNRVIWGVFHATGVSVVFLWDRLSRRSGFAFENSVAGRSFGWLATQIFVSISFVFVIAEQSNDLSITLLILLRMVGG